MALNPVNLGKPSPEMCNSYSVLDITVIIPSLQVSNLISNYTPFTMIHSTTCFLSTNHSYPYPQPSIFPGPNSLSATHSTSKVTHFSPNHRQSYLKPVHTCLFLTSWTQTNLRIASKTVLCTCVYLYCYVNRSAPINSLRWIQWPIPPPPHPVCVLASPSPSWQRNLHGLMGTGQFTVHHHQANIHVRLLNLLSPDVYCFQESNGQKLFTAETPFQTLLGETTVLPRPPAGRGGGIGER